MPWYALMHPTGYLGRQWEIFNNSPRRPRLGIVPLQKAELCTNLVNAREEARRAKGILGLDFVPVEVRIEVRGEESRIRMAGDGPAPGSLAGPGLTRERK